MQTPLSCGLTADYALHIFWLDCFADAPCTVTAYVVRIISSDIYQAVRTFGLPGYPHSRAAQGGPQVAALAEQHCLESTADQAPLSKSRTRLAKVTRNDKRRNDSDDSK